LHAELDTYPEGTKTSDGVELRDRVTPLAESAVAKKGQLSGEDIDEDDEFANCDPRIVEDLKHLQAKELVLPNDYVPVPWAATRMFKQLAKEKSLFVRGRKLVEIDKKKKELVAVPLDAFRSRIQRHRVKAAVITARKDVFLKLKECSADTAKLLLGSEAMSEHLPSLSLVTKSAVLVEREGQLVTLGPGYSADDGGILVFAQEPPPIVPLDEAIKALLDLIKEFQFVDESDLSRAMAGFIGPAIRMGKLAAHKATVNVVEADHSHAGKGYLLELSRAIYGDQGFRVSRQDGGVGSADESLGEAIFKAPPFVYIDNLRGRFASEFFESAITAPDQENVPVRLFGKGHATADISRITFQVTSNGFETTEDMGNRSLITRIRKRPNVHQFKKYDEGDVLEHVKAKQSYYIGCAFAVVREWHTKGKKALPVQHAGFHEWLGALDWIVQKVMGLKPLLRGHEAAVTRLSNPGLSWVRAVAVEVIRRKDEGKAKMASALVDISNDANLKIPGVNAATSRDDLNMLVGRVMAGVFKEGDDIDLDTYHVRRTEQQEYNPTRHEKGLVKRYTFWLRGNEGTGAGELEDSNDDGVTEKALEDDFDVVELEDDQS
jgi:hypothetical protein